MHASDTRIGANPIRQLMADRRGATAVFFAISMVFTAPMVLGLVDLYMGATQRNQLQDALDAAALFAARSTATTSSEIDVIGDRVLVANLALPDGVSLVASNFTLSDDKVVAYAEISAPGLAPGLWPHGNLKANSEVVRALDRLEIALVLDTTGSMAGNKIANLKTAGKNLVDTLSAAAARVAEPNPIKISVVPFSQAVRVQSTTALTSYVTASHSGPDIPTWLDPQGRAHVANGRDTFDVQSDRFGLMKQMGVSWNGCVESRQQPYDIQETAPDAATPATQFVPYFAPDEPDSADGFWPVYNDYRDDGTGSSSWSTRQKRSAKYSGAPSGGSAGPNLGCDMAPMLRLSTNMTSVKATIDAFVATGNTNIPMGLVWGWHTLSPNAPFADGVAYGTPKVRKIIILMTDGQNTSSVTSNTNQSTYSGLGYIWQNLLGMTSGSSAARTTRMDERLSALCSNIKARDITIYTVRVEDTSGSSTLLRNCASSPDKFYDVQTASQLNATFEAIAGSIDDLRISK